MKKTKKPPSRYSRIYPPSEALCREVVDGLDHPLQRRGVEDEGAEVRRTMAMVGRRIFLSRAALLMEGSFGSVSSEGHQGK